jgi:hypothetical protein
MCGTEAGEILEIHMLFPVYFPASEAFIGGGNAVNTVNFASPDLFISCVACEEGFLFFQY